MTGVIILDTIEIYELTGWQFLLGLSPLFIAAIIMFVRMYKAFKKGSEFDQAMMVLSPEHWSPKELITLLAGAVLSVALVGCLETFCPADYVETQYKVTVDETTSFVEFHNRYEVIEEKTDYFLVRERTD